MALAALVAYLGTVLEPKPNSLSGAIIALLALFLPGFAQEPDRARSADNHADVPRVRVSGAQHGRVFQGLG
ncbi:hypothetical protein DC366_18135 [Pelagivirga sediminicola]|uniref:Uncharacterized protein n=1 Tax=Pelagivirga sediminicola TaxID=2170575 RepID=A0A2T7G2I6_9RHOB|nr:hypothetical protein DC366_18135 [Pelagivirga sediminicola]